MLLRSAVSRGHAIGQVARLSDEELKELSRRAAEVLKTFGPEEEATSSRLDPLITAIEAYDAAAANEEIGRLAALWPASDLVKRVALP